MSRATESANVEATEFYTWKTGKGLPVLQGAGKFEHGGIEHRTLNIEHRTSK
jgi:hypothetical protein